MIADGVYRARAIQGALGQASTGSDQVAVEFEILTEGLEGQHITWFGYFTDATWERTVEALRTCGWQGDDLSDLTGLGASEVDLVIEQEEYNGKYSAKVKWINKPGGMSLKAPMSPERAQQFASEMKGRILSLKKNGTTKPAAKSAAGRTVEPPPHADSDRPPY
jgi:hypothetical protein